MYASTVAAVYSVLKDDATLTALLGGAAGDRIEHEFPLKTITFSSTLKAFIILSQESVTTIGGSGYGDDELWQARILANDIAARNAVRDRVKQVVEDNFNENGDIDLTSRLYLDGGNLTVGPPGFDDNLQVFTLNIRFTLESIAA